MKLQIIAQGAEALIIRNKNVIIKNRIPKTYRLPKLDEKLRRQRTKSESKILLKVREIINVPDVIKTEKFQIQMSYIEGEKLSKILNFKSKKEKTEIIKKIAKQVSELHDNNTIHGDLTTSNLILTQKQEVYVIDFGLGFISTKIEDKAVDIHLFRQALEAKHFQDWKELYKIFLKAYKPKEKTKILEQLKKVESRGRYKH